MSASVRMELRRLGWIMHHVQRLSPAGRAWLLARLTAVECRDDDNEPDRMAPVRGA